MSFCNIHLSPERVSSINDGHTSTGSVAKRDHRKLKITNINIALKGWNTEKTNNMGQSLVKNYIHIVFSTKYRQPLIHQTEEHELYSYLGGICNKLGCQVIKVGGYTDHIHILCMLSKKITLMKLLEELKSHSSK